MTTPSQLSTAIIRNPLTLSPHDRAAEAIALMSAGSNTCSLVCSIDIDAKTEALLAQARRSCVLVLDNEQLVGMVTERDVVRRSATEHDFSQLAIADLMLPATTLAESAFVDLFVPLDLMQAQRIANLPLIDANQRVVGLVTYNTLQRLLRPIDLFRQRTAAEIMHREVVHAPPTASLRDLTQCMSDRQVSSVVIVVEVPSEGNETAHSPCLKPLGIVTERDVIQFLALGLDFATTQAELVMSRPVFTVQPHDSLWLVQQILQERQINRVVVIDDTGNLMGIATQSSLLSTLNSVEIYQMAETLEQKVSRLEAEKMELLRHRNTELELQVQIRTIELQRQAEWERFLAQQAQAELSERLRIETLLAVQAAVLERIAKADPLLEILRDLVLALEGQLAESLISILLKNEAGQLETAIAPHLPRPYVQAIAKVEIGEGVGCCGTAAFRCERVIVADIATHPFWENFRDIALANGLQACWSQPILDNDEEVLGTFAIYYAAPKVPHPKALETLGRAASIAGIAITHDRAQQALAQLNQDLEQKVQERTAALQQSEERWHLALQGTSDAIWDWDAATNKVFYSKPWQTMRGFAPQETSSPLTEWVQAIHPDDRAETLARLNEHLHGQTEFYVAEYRVLCRDESYLWVLDRGQALRDETGQPIRMAGSKTDISDRKWTEQVIRRHAEQETLLREVTQHIRQSLHLLEVFDTACEEIRQFIQADRVGIFKFHPDSNFVDGEFLAESRIGPYPSVLTMPVRDHCFAQSYASQYATGRFFVADDIYTCGLSPCHIDILAQFQVRATLVVPLLCNRGLWGLLCIQQCLNPRHWQQSDIDLIHQIANQLNLAIQQSQLFDQLQQELAERQQTQEQLAERNQQLAISNEQLARATRLKDEFLANMSHELRTPLNAILGVSEALLDDVLGPLSQTQRKMIALVESSGQHLLSLINDILDVAKIEAGRIELIISTVSISHLCSSSLNFVKQQALQKQIQLKVNQLVDFTHIAVDERRMRQLLINLLINAVKFTPMGGCVTLAVSLEPLEMNLSERVSLFRPKPQVEFFSPPPASSVLENYCLCFSVTDTGIGVSAAYQDKLFQPFVQVDSSLNRQYEGTGLGLTLVKQIAELHGGSVRLLSEPGQGSCFMVHLPISCVETDLVLPSPLAGANSPLPNPKTHLEVVTDGPLILLAEDNSANVATIGDYLVARGFRLLVAEQGETAVALAQSHRPDAILMDIQMPGVDGLEAIRRIRADASLGHIPIIALTALTMSGDRERCLATGANDYLAKPVKLKHLVETLHSWLNVALPANTQQSPLGEKALASE